MKKLLALLLCTLMLLSLLPISVFAVDHEETDLWQQITELEDQASSFRRAYDTEARAKVYGELSDNVVELVEASKNFVPGSIVRHGDFFYWDEKDGTACGYSPRLRAAIREGADPNADPEAFSGIETVSYADRGGFPNSVDVAAFQPYIGIDSSFSAQYENECKSIAQALGGTGITYKTTNATIDNIAYAIENSAVVIFDSHGDTDYASGYDYTSQANTSYICLQTGAGFTAADQAYVTGPYGQYRHAYYGGGYGNMQYYMCDGTAISNHMTGTSPNGLLWMAICLGMATDGMQAALRAKGVEVAYGYSQSVTFAGDYAWEAKFWQKMKAGEYVKDAIAYMKQQVGCPDPYTSMYPAYPIVVSSEDNYPGHGNVDANQTVYSTWTLFTQFTVTAVSNNTEWGTTAIQGNKIIATPKTGYYTDGYEILEGDAIVEQNGNVFTVTPESDCTIQINFAPRDPAVVHFSVPEGVSCEEINAYVGDEVALPEPEGEPSVESRSFRFIGWVTAPMAEDSLDVPEFLSAGTKIKLTETESTYYALYTYFVAVEGLDEDQFLRVDEAPHSWTGEYVITYQGAYALGATKDYIGSNANNRLGVKKSVVDLASIGCVYEGNILDGVTDAITYVIEPAENGTYSIRMKTVNHYLAMGADSDSLTTYTSCGTNKSRWNISYGANGPVLTNAQFTNRNLQYDASGKIFSCFTTAKQPLTLFAKADGDNWYTTDPKEKALCEEHSFGDWIVEEEPTCTEAGSQYRICSVCGFKETQAIEAFGHDYEDVITEPTCTEQGYTTHTCIICGNVVEDTYMDALGHDYVAVLTEPTCTEQGYTTHTCTRCGDSYIDSYVEATGHTYGAPVFTWNEALTEANAVFTCACGDEQVLEAEITEEIITEALPHIAGEKKLIASVTFENVEYTDEKTVEIEALPCPCEMFVDMPEYGTIEHTAIDWAFTHEPQITEGMDATHFGYGQTVTRAQAMRFLWNAADQPDPASEENPFEDVKLGKWYTTPVLWAYNAALRITNGMDDTHFGINVGCTRAHIITFLWNAFGKPMTSIENPYTDVTKPDGSSRFYTDAAIWAYEAGIEKGENGHFNPDTNCTRESIVVYLYRFFTGQGLLN